MPHKNWKEDTKEGLLMIAKLVAMYAAVLAVAATLTPLVHPMVEALGIKVSTGRTFDRLRYVGLLLMLPLVWGWAGIKSWKDLGWSGWKRGLMWMLGGAMSVCAVGYLLSMGMVAGQGLGTAKMLELVLKGALAGVALGILEEVVFRGIFQRMLVRKLGVVGGIVLAAGLYAWLHGRATGAQTSWQMAWSYLTQWPGNLTPVALGNLLALGLTLGTLYHKTKTLWVPVGLHAGVVAAAVPVLAVLHNADPQFDRQALATSAVAGVMLWAWAVWALCTRAKPATADTDAGRKA